MSTSPRPPRAPGRLSALIVATIVTAAGALGAPAGPATAAVHSFTATGRVSVTTTGAEKVHDVGDVVALSADGRFVAFTSTAVLATGDTNGQPDAYLRDRLGGTTTRVSLTDADTQIQGPAHVCALSRDARWVVFAAKGTGLPVAGSYQLYLRDRRNRTTAIVSVDSDEQPAALNDGTSGIVPGERCAVSDDGRFVAFTSDDGDLAPGASYVGDVFRRDRYSGVTQLANVGANGAVPNGASGEVSMSGDGAFVAFSSTAGNLVSGDTNGDQDVFFRYFAANITQRASRKAGAGGAQVEGASSDPSISADGDQIAFTSAASDLVAGDGNGYPDVFVRDRIESTVVRASIGSEGELGSGGSHGDLSDDGQVVTFEHYTPAPSPQDPNGDDDVLRRDLQTGTTTYVSVARDGKTGNEQSHGHAVSGDGTAVAFVSAATNLVRGDGNGSDDVFVRDLDVATTPFGNGEGFIHQQYVDFVGRAPTPTEAQTWSTRFSHGEAVPEQLIDELAHAPAWTGKRPPVIRLYWAFFLRVPDKGGLEYWVGEANKGLSLPKMASKFAQSKEFKDQYGSLTSSAFVTAIYQNIFDRDPDAAGLAYWKGQLDTGAKTRGDVMVGFSESAEGKLLLAPAVDSVLVWLGMMRTVPPSWWSIDGVAEDYRLGDPPEILPQGVLGLPAYADRVD